MSKIMITLLLFITSSAIAGEGVCTQLGLDKGCTTYQAWDEDHAAWWCTCPEPTPPLHCLAAYGAAFDNDGNWSCEWVGRM
jgi:hypothetical protein